MILQRISENVRSQNWFAVAVEFIIVVVGVFMGLQVQDWNEARKARIQEQGLLSRLHVETLELLETQREELMGLSERAVFRRPPDELPVLDEMLSTGRFDVLQDEDIKEHLRNYVLFRARGRAYYQEATNELFRLHSRFPNLIAIGRVPIEAGLVEGWARLSGEGFRWDPACDGEKMRASPAFLNEYVDNQSRIGSMIEFTKQRQEHLEELESALSARLGAAAISGSQE
jgi:hypothetical protein